MSSLDILRSFAESREHDAVLIRDGISYGNVRETLRVMAELEAKLQAGRDLMAVVHRDGGDYRQTHGDRKAADDAIAIVIDLRAELAAERERWEEAEVELDRVIAARNRDHQQALANGVALAAERERREAAEWVLKEIRIRLHAAGRRPEECWEMSEIDGHLAQFEHRKD